MSDRVSARQREVLGIIDAFGSECWGDVWSHCDTWPGSPGLAFRNFDRVAKSLVRKGLVNDDGDTLEITEDGRRFLPVLGECHKLTEKQQRARLAECLASEKDHVDE